jgi:long-chain fatty acid transport protein
MKKIVILFATLIAALVTPTLVFGLGVRLPSQDAFATARGEAFAATADNPSAIYYNPAGITQLDDSNIRVGIYGIAISDHESSSKGSANTTDKIQAVPELYYTLGLKNTQLFKDIPLTIGLGAYAPYGLAMEWPHNTTFNTLGQKGSIDYFTVNPVIAWQVSPTFSIAAGLTVNTSTADLEYDVPVTDTTGRLKFKGSDTTPGFNLGARWQPSDQLAFGFNYKSATTMGYHGTVGYTSASGNSSASSTADFNFPQTIVGGVSWRPNTNWNAEVDADWTDWNTLKTLSPSLSVPINLYIPGTPYAYPLTSIVKNFNWKPSWLFEFGVTRYFDNGLRLSGGYIYSQNSVPNDAGFSPLIPDSDRHIWSVGLGGNLRKLTWDVTYQLAWGPSRNVTGSTPDPNTLQSANGTYEFISHAILISIGYKF